MTITQPGRRTHLTHSTNTGSVMLPHLFGRIAQKGLGTKNLPKAITKQGEKQGINLFLRYSPIIDRVKQKFL